MYPEQVKAHLDRYVVKQTTAKEMLAVAVCDHYNRANEELLQDAAATSEPTASEKVMPGNQAETETLKKPPEAEAKATAANEATEDPQAVDKPALPAIQK